MKRFFIFCIVAVLAHTSAYGWWGSEHATVAQIAENHLTPKAKAFIKEYFEGRPMAYYSAHPDLFREKMLVDAGFELEDGTRMAAFSHAFCLDTNLKPMRTNRDANGNFVKNSLYDMERAAKRLKEGHATMDPAERQMLLYCIVHSMGDMHCPVHIELKLGNPTPHGKYRIFYIDRNKKINKSLHGLWEMRMISGYSPWSYSDLAKILDTYSEEQIAEICKGDLYTWGEDAAHSAAIVYNECKPGTTINLKQFQKRFQPLAEELIQKAGYRLAKVLNDIFN